MKKAEDIHDITKMVLWRTCAPHIFCLTVSYNYPRLVNYNYMPNGVYCTRSGQYSRAEWCVSRGCAKDNQALGKRFLQDGRLIVGGWVTGRRAVAKGR